MQEKKKKGGTVFSFHADAVLTKHILVEAQKQPIRKASWALRALLRKVFNLSGGGHP